LPSEAAIQAHNIIFLHGKPYRNSRRTGLFLHRRLSKLAYCPMDRDDKS